MDSAVQFQNEPVDPAALPDFSEVELHSVEAAFRTYQMLSNLLWGLLIGVGVSLAFWLFWGFRAMEWGQWLGLIILIGLQFHAVLDPRYRGWALRDHDLIAREGVIWRGTVVLPIARIQHVETASGPLERLFGLMRLQCYSAGGMTADVVVHGLKPETALRIRSHLLQHIGDAPRG
ncbi:PH domain-containing protein [Natronospira bacteriovora]|uniref:PH domain-containing protein n=1 Tax=Natronospira bacteriovora TaxID=3069753 RepID=A0ABU0W5C1_9GAMM|nr:PH domain-containing protein [Natronospira sp. AB-CW4]MDQ2069221.1 PH domain-containing protein [Natronospira sp. AB-CW4]